MIQNPYIRQMRILFSKYQAAGNDFIIIDNRTNQVSLNIQQIQWLCHRKFGVGADGLILIEEDPHQDFKMVFYNPDGSQSLCGNGCRAAIRFSESFFLNKKEAHFSAFDGVHKAQIHENTINLQMGNVQNGRIVQNGIFIDTGSPHFVLIVPVVETVDVITEGRKWRYSNLFSPEGVNVNFVQIINEHTIKVSTYERGVENETLSCGTGVTAAALAASAHGCGSPVKILTKGGDLQVKFKVTPKGFNDVWLEGPAKPVFSGTIDLKDR